MRRRYFIIGLMITASLSALVAFVQQRHRGLRCSLDGSLIQPFYGVEIIQANESSRKFCCILNAQIWSVRNRNPVSSIWVTDEITGEKLRAEEAFYVSSSVITTPHTRNRIHVFAEKEAAQIHAGQFNGKLVTNPLKASKKKPVKIATYMPDSHDNTGFVQTSSQKPLCLAWDVALIWDPSYVGKSRRCSYRLPLGFSKPPDKPPQSFSYEAVGKPASAALRLSFVTATYVHVRLIPQDFARLASAHFPTASKVSEFRQIH